MKLVLVEPSALFQTKPTAPYPGTVLSTFACATVEAPISFQGFLPLVAVRPKSSGYSGSDDTMDIHSSFSRSNRIPAVKAVTVIALLENSTVTVSPRCASVTLTVNATLGSPPAASAGTAVTSTLRIINTDRRRALICLFMTKLLSFFWRNRICVHTGTRVPPFRTSVSGFASEYLKLPDLCHMAYDTGSEEQELICGQSSRELIILAT